MLENQKEKHMTYGMGTAVMSGACGLLPVPYSNKNAALPRLLYDGENVFHRGSRGLFQGEGIFRLGCSVERRH